MTDDASLNAIAPPEVTLQIENQTVRIRPLTIGQLPAFSRAIAPAVPVLQRLFEQVSAADDGEMLIGTEEIISALEASGAVVDAVCIASTLDREFLDRQGLDVLVKLAGAVFQVNADFFGRALAPAAVEVVGAALGATGTQSSLGSSAQGSVDPMSSG